MNEGKQLSSLLIGSEEAVLSLAQKETSRIIVYSDSHGSPFTVQRILSKKGKNADALIFCGDGISDISACFTKALFDKDFAECIPPVISFVRGNCDEERFPFKNMSRLTDSSAPFYVQIEAPLSQTLCVSGFNIFSAHGHKYSFDFGINDILKVGETFNSNIILYGHSHIAGSQLIGNILALNPGSCAKPRAGQKPCFAELVFTKGKSFPDYSFYEASECEGDFPLYNLK